MVIVEGWVRLSDGELDRFEAAGKEMILASRAEAGCIDYSYARDLIDPLLIRISEKWRDSAALDTHFAEPHMARFQAALATIKREAGDVRVYSAEELRRLI